MSIFEKKNIFVWPKCWFVTKMMIFDQNVDFWPECQFLTKLSIFDRNVDFWPECRFLTKMSIFDQNVDFWPKCRLLTKISILRQISFFTNHFWRKFFSLRKNSVSLRNCHRHTVNVIVTKTSTMTSWDMSLKQRNVANVYKWSSCWILGTHIKSPVKNCEERKKWELTLIL